LDSNLISQGTNNKEVSENTNSKRVQNRVHKSANCPELEQIITAWPELSEKVKTKILEIIKAPKDKG